MGWWTVTNSITNLKETTQSTPDLCVWAKYGKLGVKDCGKGHGCLVHFITGDLPFLLIPYLRTCLFI